MSIHYKDSLLDKLKQDASTEAGSTSIRKSLIQAAKTGVSSPFPRPAGNIFNLGGAIMHLLQLGVADLGFRLRVKGLGFGLYYLAI